METGNTPVMTYREIFTRDISIKGLVFPLPDVSYTISILRISSLPSPYYSTGYTFQNLHNAPRDGENRLAFTLIHLSEREDPQ